MMVLLVVVFWLSGGQRCVGLVAGRTPDRFVCGRVFAVCRLYVVLLGAYSCPGFLYILRRSSNKHTTTPTTSSKTDPARPRTVLFQARSTHLAEPFRPRLQASPLEEDFCIVFCRRRRRWWKLQPRFPVDHRHDDDRILARHGTLGLSSGPFDFKTQPCLYSFIPSPSLCC